MSYGRGYVPDYVDRCPICKRKGFSDYQVAQIDQFGYSQCPNCGDKVTRSILSNYWNEMERKQQKIDERRAKNKWWQFWK